MKFLKLSAYAFLSAAVISCGGSSEKEAEEFWNDLAESIEDNMDGSTSSNEWSTQGDNQYFELDVPGHMNSMYDLNQEAALQYGYVEQSGLEVLEHYVIVLMETKEEIDGYDLDMDFDALSYSEISVESLKGGLDDYTVLTKDPEIIEVNGMDCVKNQMRGSLGDVNVYYELGVFEGDKAFYQVLTWCIEEQKDKFKSDMDKIIESFKEI